jgi:hypothetical protein
VRVGVLFLPFSMYYALINQRGSSWTYQASLMDGSLVCIKKITKFLTVNFN